MAKRKEISAGKILVIDDELAIRSTLQDILTLEHYEVLLAEDGVQGLRLYRDAQPDVVLCDIKMPGLDGIEVLEALLQLGNTPVVMISGHGTIETAVQAIRMGAFDYIEKPLDLNRLLTSMRTALDTGKPARNPQPHNITPGTDLPQMIGDSPAMQAIRQLIARVAPTPARVLITGENGTGKELVARAIHAQSRRNTGEFIEVNCAAIPAELIESELFGHEKGAFTSAIRQHKGKFELADGGSLFLDEIGDMSLSAQSKVLRALQEGVITRVGGDRQLAVNPRIISATNKDLPKEIEQGRFREDLYHRVNVIPIHVPPLRARGEDIPLLVNHFVTTLSGRLGTPVRDVQESAYQALRERPWPGNVRELQNVVERLLIMTDGPIGADDVAKWAN